MPIDELIAAIHSLGTVMAEDIWRDTPHRVICNGVLISDFMSEGYEAIVFADCIGVPVLFHPFLRVSAIIDTVSANVSVYQLPNDYYFRGKLNAQPLGPNEMQNTSDRFRLPEGSKQICSQMIMGFNKPSDVASQLMHGVVSHYSTTSEGL